MKTRLTNYAMGLTSLMVLIGAPIIAQNIAESPRETPTAGYQPMSERERMEFNARNMEAARRSTAASQPVPAEARPIESYFVRGQEKVRDAGLGKLLGYLKSNANRTSADLAGEPLTTVFASGHNTPVESIDFSGGGQSGARYSFVVRRYPEGVPADLMNGVEGKTTFSPLDVSEVMERVQIATVGSRSSASKGKFGAQVIAVQAPYYVVVVVNQPNPNRAADIARKILNQLK